MSLEISYFSGVATGGVPVAADEIRADSLTLSSTSALTTEATPDTAAIVYIFATENARYAYGLNHGKAPTASATTGFLAAGNGIWLAARAGHKVAGKTA